MPLNVTLLLSKILLEVFFASMLLPCSTIDLISKVGLIMLFVCFLGHNSIQVV